MPPDKDAPFFFKNDNETQGFLKRFDNAPAGSLVGDACASYFWTRNTGPYPTVFNSNISSAIRQHLGDKLKLIVMLKDPVQRSVSAYLHHIAHGSLDISCSILDAPKELGIISLSRYSLHLKHWREDYPLEQLLVLQPLVDGQDVNGQALVEHLDELSINRLVTKIVEDLCPDLELLDTLTEAFIGRKENAP